MPDPKKINLALVFGGRSCEHEVSVNSARNIYQALDRDKYEITLIGISHEGRWVHVEDDGMLLRQASVDAKGLRQVTMDHCGGSSLMVGNPDAPGSVRKIPVDVVFPVLHGPFGEDGTIQGLFEMANVAYVGSGVTGSAAAMDKVIAKRLFAAVGLPQSRYTVVRASEWESSRQDVLSKTLSEIVFPMFVKPANLGSSVGISKVESENDLIAAIEFALQFDLKIVIEEGFENCHEVEVSVLGNDSSRASVVGEIIPASEFYDYSDKYIDGKAELLIPARISERAAETVREYALRAFAAVDAAGLARVDFFVKKRSDAVYINEINTMPGFTNISMYPKMWEASGIGYADLIDRLVQLAVERRSRRNTLKTAL